MKILIVVILIISALFAGCLSEKNTLVNKNVILDIEPSNINIKNGEVKQIQILVNNAGESSIDAVVRFKINAPDRPYLNFTPESYNSGILRPGEDSGHRNVDIRAYIPAGSNITYPVRVEAVDNNKGVVIDSKELTITVERS